MVCVGNNSARLVKLWFFSYIGVYVRCYRQLDMTSFGFLDDEKIEPSAIFLKTDILADCFGRKVVWNEISVG